MGHQFVILLESLVSSETEQDLIRGTGQLISYMNGVFPSVFPETYEVLIRKLLGCCSGFLRGQGLRLIELYSPWSSPSKVDIFLQYTKDIDYNVRTTALCYIKECNPELITELFKDPFEEVQIAAAHCFFRSTRILGDDEYSLIKLEPLAMSQYKNVVLEALKVISQLTLSSKIIYALLNNDRMKAYSGMLLDLLESECFEVRLAVLSCLRNLINSLLLTTAFHAITHIVYAVVKLLLDAINDEFREVRISVFELLGSLTPYFILKKTKDVDSCLFNLRESDQELRNTIYSFLSKVKIELNTNILKITETLLNLLNLFPEDRDSIFSVFSCMGRENYKHSDFVLSKVLGIDQRFISSEQNWNDPEYIAKLIFLANSRCHDSSLKLPATCEKHINYIADLYPMHIPLNTAATAPDSGFIVKTNLELNRLCRDLMRKHNKIITQPQCYYRSIESVVKDLIYISLKIQFRFEISTETLKTDLVQLRIHSHILLLLGLLSDKFTCRKTDADTVVQQLNNIWKAANSSGLSELAHLCYSFSNDLNYDKMYDSFIKTLRPIVFHKPADSEVKQRAAEITYPIGEVTVNECDSLLVQGRGPPNLYCIIEYPDSTQEISKLSLQANHLVSNIRIHRPNFPLGVRMCLGVLYDSHSILEGSGFYAKTLSLREYIPISKYSSILLKP